MSNISIGKGNQTMKFGQLIEYKMKYIFLEKPYIQCGREVSPRLFYKKSKLSVSLDQQSEILQSLLLLPRSRSKSRSNEIY